MISNHVPWSASSRIEVTLIYSQNNSACNINYTNVASDIILSKVVMGRRNGGW